jgi:hypothetical protein
MVIKYPNISHSKALRNMSKLGVFGNKPSGNPDRKSTRERNVVASAIPNLLFLRRSMNPFPRFWLQDVKVIACPFYLYNTQTYP